MDKNNFSVGHYNIPIAYLRAFIIVIVLAAHTVLYHSQVAPAFPVMSKQSMLWLIIPVIDGQQSAFFTQLQIFLNIFDMSLMFFLSGLFVWKSLRKKGSIIFLRDRLIRLGLPFILMLIIIPFTYIPTYLQTNDNGTFTGFWKEWTSLGIVTAGPGWFIFLLLVFDIVSVILYNLIPEKFRVIDKLKLNLIMQQPVILFVILILLSSAVYIPMTLRFPDWYWFNWGPFWFQVNRVFLYLLYFIAGIFTGAYGINRTIYNEDSRLSGTWFVWIFIAALATIIRLKLVPGLDNMSAAGNSLIFIFCNVSCSFAVIAVFLRFVRKWNKYFDSFYSNSYGIYIIHYVIISWLQYSLLNAPLPPLAKGPVVFACALILCWVLAAVIRRIPGVARVI